MDVIEQLSDEIDNQNAFDLVVPVVDIGDVDDPGKLNVESQAWVLELMTDAGQNTRDMGSPVQMEKQLFAVVIGLRLINDVDGERSLPDLREKRLAVRKALFGFTPNEGANGYEPLTLAGSKLMSLQTGAVFWLERFQTKHQIDQENLI